MQHQSTTFSIRYIHFFFPLSWPRLWYSDSLLLSDHKHQRNSSRKKKEKEKKIFTWALPIGFSTPQGWLNHKEKDPSHLDATARIPCLAAPPFLDAFPAACHIPSLMLPHDLRVSLKNLSSIAVLFSLPGNGAAEQRPDILQLPFPHHYVRQNCIRSRSRGWQSPLHNAVLYNRPSTGHTRTQENVLGFQPLREHEYGFCSLEVNLKSVQLFYLA